MSIKVGDALLSLGIDTTDLDQGMQTLGNKMQKHRKAIGLAVTAAGAAIVGGLSLAMKAAADFEAAMREVNTMMGLSQEEFTEFSKDVQDLTSRLGVDAVESAKALYQAISAGIPKENVLEFLEIATKAAIGGVTETKIAVDGLTTVINAFKMPIEEAERVADLMFTTVKGGKTTFEELSASMNVVAPIAASLGVKFEDLMAATATLTKQGAPTSIAMTQIRSSLVALTKPTKEMQDLLEKLGYESGEAMLKALGYARSLAALRDAANNNNQVLATAFGRVEGLNAVLGLTGDNAKMAAADIQSMADSMGAASGAFEEMEQSTSRQLTKLKSSFSDIAISVGNVLLPILTDIIDKIKPIIEGIKDWMKAHPGLTKAIVITAGAVGGLMLALGPLIIALPPLIGMFKTLGLTSIPLVGKAVVALGVKLTALLGPIALVVAAIGAITWALIQLRKNAEIHDLNRRLAEEHSKAIKGLKNDYAELLLEAEAMGHELGRGSKAYALQTRMVQEYEKAVAGLDNEYVEATQAVKDFGLTITPAQQAMLDAANSAGILGKSVSGATNEVVALSNALAQFAGMYPGGMSMEEMLKFRKETFLPALEQAGYELPMRGMQTGGIAIRPMTARLAEKSPEAVIPLDRLETVVGGYRTANIYFQIGERELVRILGQPLVDEIRARTGLTI